MQPSERAAAMVELFSKAPIGRHLGMTLSYDEEVRAVFDIVDAPYLHHALGQVHGGVIATLIDSAAWFTAAVHYDTWISTVDFSVRLLEPADDGDLQAIGSVVRIGRRLAAADAEVRTASGRLVAVGGGTFAVTGVAYG